MTDAAGLLFSLRSLAIAISLLSAGAASAEVQGGLLGGLAGTPERCTESVCNLYYGDTPPEDAAVETTVAPPTVAGSTLLDSYVAPHAARGGRDVVANGERSSCEPSPPDPWRCYRR